MSQLYRKFVGILPYSFKNVFNITRIKVREYLTYWVKRRQVNIQHFKDWLNQQPLYWAYRLYIRRETPIIVYQMGKVGSISVYLSLLEAGYFAFHTHTFDDSWFDDYFKPTTMVEYRSYSRRWDWLYKHVIKPHRPTKIITLTRDIVGQNLSFFFHRLDDNTGVKNAADNLSAEELIPHYHQYKHTFYDYMGQWFERDFKHHLGIDVYSHEFDSQKGYTRIQQTPYDVLILHLEIPDEEKVHIIADFLNISGLKWRNGNVAADKQYADAYTRFKKAMRFPDEMLDSIYASPLVTHFYTPEQIEKFKTKWRQS